MVAAGEEKHRRKRLHFVTEEGNIGYLLFKINIKDLFSSDLQAQSRSMATEMEIRNLPSPVAQFKTLVGVPERMDFALVGTTIVGVSCSNRTVMYDTRSGVYSAGPEPQHEKCGGSYVVELGHRLYALKRLFTVYDEEQPCGESLLLHLPPAPPRREPWRALPEPPADFRRLDLSNSSCQVTAYFTAGTRLWVSAKRRGTYSLDTVRRVWRKEGDWELPFHYRGLMIPKLGNLCFGLCRETNCLCACDIQQSPPVVRYMWEETFPQWPSGVRATAMYPQGNLAYLGDGKFCIAWTIGIGDPSCLRRAIFVMALQVSHTTSGSGELRMVKHKVCCYEMPNHGRMAYVL